MNDQTLGRKKRLASKAQFRAFFDNAEVFRLGNCTIFRIPNEKGFFRLGITLKIRTSAIFRNQVRRIIRESLRKKELGSFDYNVVVQKKGDVTRTWINKFTLQLEQWKALL